MNKDDIKGIRQLLTSPKRIAIIPHRSPDGDAMGSTLGLYHFLLKLGHNPFVIAPNEFPDFLAWLPGSEKVSVFEKDKETGIRMLQEADIVFTLDFNALHRTGEMEHTLVTLKVPFVMIDHHQKPDSYATFMYSDTTFGSTCEMLYNFIREMDGEHLIDRTIATCIYTGIVTDSGSFRYPSTTSATHRIVANLIELGIDNSEVHTLLFDNNSFDRLQLMGQALQNMKVFPEHKTAYITLSQKELDQHHYVKGDTEGLVNYGLSIKGIIFAAIFIEHREENIIKISFRSQGNFDVNQFARDHFNGGGHINAAGGKSYQNMRDTIKKFENIIKSL
ncbi:DHH family phosphoesterase [Flavobacterium magnum]|uniref:DHH family phosphoesterase n=1 Tax=Flavobacterium magnum TaxID=2162713 RepID=A0A2S0RHU5_9FLAO|nr:bifunctional oligoribonuclease/PAP phosphatase NrnA [Flavobacterium magnum]AWA31195.1 DHH family phosphoesterase [Flavobacterium magnum]